MAINKKNTIFFALLFSLGVHAQITDVSSCSPIQANKLNELIQKVHELSYKVIELEKKILTIGSIVHSLLNLSQYQMENGDCWRAMDGFVLSGTDELKSLYGYNNIPNASSRFLRNSGASSSPLGLTQEDEIKSHSHFEKRSTGAGGGGGLVGTSGHWGLNNANSSISTNNTGGDETRPKNLTVNLFIKFKKSCTM